MSPGLRWSVVGCLATLAMLVAGCPFHDGVVGVCWVLDTQITTINGSTAPVVRPGEVVEIVGRNFLAGDRVSVRFQQGATTVDMIPISWTDTTILVTVPSNLAAPGSASVGVAAFGPCGLNGATSKPATLYLAGASSFSPASVAWAATPPLPTPLRAHAAVAVRANSTQAWVYVIGGNNGTADVSSVLVASLDQNGNVGSWTATNPIPASRAFHAVAEADPTNAPVPVGQAFIYAIGGQQTASDAPGGTSTAFVGSVNLATGAVVWSSTLTATLPETRVGCKAVVSRGFLHVTGGLNPSGSTIAVTASAPVLASGQLGSFYEGIARPPSLPPSALPLPVAFHEMFASGGFLYVIGGDLGPQTTPFNIASGQATNYTWSATISHGEVGPWLTTSKTITSREKSSVLFALGQVLVYEGAYGSTNVEAERTALNADGSLGPFAAQSGGTLPSLNVFNGAGVASPILTTANSPRFLLIGGDSVVTPGTLTTIVDRTTAP